MILLNNGLLCLKIAENGDEFSVEYEGKIFNSLNNSYYLRGEEKVCFSSLNNTTTDISDEKLVGIKFDFSVFTTKIWSERFSTKIHFEIEEKILPRIFESFMKGEHGNFGLGLNIIQRSLGMLDYTVQLQNTEKGVMYKVMPIV